jgi:hypothetical protein
MKIILKLIFNTLALREWTGLIGLSMGTRGGHL